MMSEKSKQGTPSLEQFFLSLYEDSSEEEIRLISKSMGLNHDKLLEEGEQIARKAMRDAKLKEGAAFQHRAAELLRQIRTSVEKYSPKERLSKAIDLLKNDSTQPAVVLCRHLEKLDAEELDDVLEDSILLNMLAEIKTKENDRK